jgi:hypothetical protein
MTLQEFITLHTTGIINNARWINILYNEEENTLGPASISAITITEEAASYNGITDGIQVNIETILGQVEVVRLTFDGVDYEFTVNSTVYYPMENGNSFYLYEVTSNVQVPNILDADLAYPEYGTSVNFEPVINTAVFSTSNYNVTINNATNLRKSTLKQQSDREAGLIVPTNFNVILTNSASKAEVQDSFYTTTGIVNARYRGSKTTPSDSGGVSPALTAREFAGEIFPLDVNRDYACGILNPGRVLENLLHTGPNINPGYTTSSLNIQTLPPPSGELGDDDLVFQYSFTTFTGNLNPQIDSGDLLVFDSNISTEIMRVNFHNQDTNQLVVTRGHLGTEAVQVPNETEIFKIVRTDILREGTFVSNLRSIGDSIIYVQEDNSLVYTDSYGAIYSSSLCPDPLLLGIDDSTPP